MVVFVVSGSCENLLAISADHDCKNAISMVEKVVEGVKSDGLEFQDIVFLRLSQSKASKQKIDDLADAIAEVIYRKNVITIPELTQHEGMKLAEMVVIVTDIHDSVS
jgi:hypothetical protein